jgi:uncharacterized protein (TIGR03083 family)
MTEQLTAPQLIARIHETNDRLETLLGRLGVDQMNRPGAVGAWSVKDVLAHLAFWERYGANLLRAIAQGETPELDAEDMTETRNASVVAQYYLRPLSAVVADWQAASDELIELIADLSPQDLNDPDRFAWSPGRTLLDRLTGNSYGHMEEHIAQIREWMGRF